MLRKGKEGHFFLWACHLAEWRDRVFSKSHLEEKSRLMFRVNFWKPVCLNQQMDLGPFERVHKEVSLCTRSAPPGSMCLSHIFSHSFFFQLSESPLSGSLCDVLFFTLSPFPSLIIFLQLTVLFMSLSILLNQSLTILFNANALLSLDGYPRSDCWKMKHTSFSYFAEFQAEKFIFFPVVNMFLFDLASAVLLARMLGKQQKMWPRWSYCIREKVSKTCVCRAVSVSFRWQFQFNFFMHNWKTAMNGFSIAD